MQGEIKFGPGGVNLNLGFASIEEIKQFVEQALQGPAEQYGYSIEIKKVAQKEQKKGNVGVA